MDQEPYTQYNDGSGGRVLRISTWGTGNTSPQMGQAVGTIPRHWFLPSGAKQRKEDRGKAHL